LTKVKAEITQNVQKPLGNFIQDNQNLSGDDERIARVKMTESNFYQK